MKKILLWMITAALMLGCACAETARDYALWLEEALPGSSFTDAATPDFVNEQLGMDYEFIARSDENYGSYIAGVRRSDASALPEGAHQTAYEGTFESRVFQAADAQGNVLYEFVLAQDVYMRAYDQLERLLVWIDPNGGGGAFSSPDTLIFNAGDPQYRAKLLYEQSMGFSSQDDSRMQLRCDIHNLDSWQAGATNQPSSFYLNMSAPDKLLGEEYLEEEALIQYARIPIGLCLQDGDQGYELVLSENGVLGVETYAPHRLYAAGEGCEAVLNLAEKVLGYRPGRLDFIGRNCVRATLQWQAGSIVLEDAEKLRRLDALLDDADFTVGSVNCPSPCFLSLEFADGSREDMAVAVNSFDLFFCEGMYFTTEQDIVDLFDLRDTDFYREYMGG